jgi:hypothetical protein
MGCSVTKILTDQNKIDLKSARTASGLHSSSHVSSAKDQQMNPYMIQSTDTKSAISPDTK